MSANNPQPTQHIPSHWPTILWFLAAIGVPGAAAVTFAGTISKNPWQAFALAVLYECCVLFLAFLRKVWLHLEDAWSKDTATWVNNLVQKQWFSYKGYYARFLTFQHRDFDIKGLSTQSVYTLELEQVFVDVSIDPKPIHDVTSNPIPVPEDLRTGHHSLWSYLAAQTLKHQHLVILGAPGSGKTTLLKYLALTLVNRKKRQFLARHIRRAYNLPFLLFLREHAEAIQSNPHFSLEEAIENILHRWERLVPEGWVRRQLSKGRCLILLDGLDEVANATIREQVAKWVQRQMEMYAANRFLISSRPFGYRSNPLSGVMVLEVQPFTLEHIERFIHNWYRANEVMSSRKDDPGVRMRAKAGAQDLVRRIQQNFALSSLAVNPLLLTMIATIHRYRSTLPGKRVELYAEICEVFLGKRQQARDIRVDLRPAQCVSVLQPLAYEMMIRQQREITSLEAQEIIKEALQLVHEQMTSQMFLQAVEDMSGLLLEREQGNYSFAHLTFQEYLAATHIREQGLEATLIAHLEESWWEETIRLYSAQADATEVIKACLQQATQSVSHLVLALECQEEALKVQPMIKLQLDKVLEQRAEDSDPIRRKVVAEALLKRRLKELVPVREGVYRDTSLILSAEYQLFLDEQRSLGKYYQPDHWMQMQFPAEQALLPVVGVRPAATQAFCQWLTQREQGLWQYRLPKPGECQPGEVHIRPAWLPSYSWNAALGYWKEEEGYSFEWVQQPAAVQAGTVLSEQLAQVIPLDLDMVRIDDDASMVMQAKTTGWEHLLDYLSRTRDRTSDLAYARAHDLTRASDLVHTRARARARSLSLTRDLASNLALASDLANNLANNLANDLARALASDLTHARDLAYNLVSDLARASTHDLAYAHARDLGSNLTHASAYAKDLTNDLASDLVHASDLGHNLASALTRDFAYTRDFTSDLAHDLIRTSILFLDFARIESQCTVHYLDLAQLLALLSVCVSLSMHELANMLPHISARSFWKRLFALHRKREESLQAIQCAMNQGIEIYRRLERLKQRRQGKEPVCEGILIVKELKRDEIALLQSVNRPTTLSTARIHQSATQSYITNDELVSGTTMQASPPESSHVTYQLQYRKCGKASCSTCRNGQGHGPYWYAYWREGSRLRSRYVGKVHPN